MNILGLLYHRYVVYFKDNNSFLQGNRTLNLWSVHNQHKLCAAPFDRDGNTVVLKNEIVLGGN